ncbi:MAG: sialidase family protein [Planctomycetota bacterium]
MYPSQEKTRGFRRKIIGWDVNAPEFEGFGGKVGLAQDCALTREGEIFLVTSAGYWHVSMATPYVVPEEVLARWEKSGFPRGHVAPRGGRIVSIRSRDAGRSWTAPVTAVDTALSDEPPGIAVLRDGTVVLVVSEQASWYGLLDAPVGHPRWNTRVGVTRSTDSGRTWSEITWLAIPSRFYQRCFSKPVELADGTLLLPTYCQDEWEGKLFGAVHRSDDGGKSWRLLSKVQRADGGEIDEPSIAELPDGRLIMITRLDGGILYSDDKGRNWSLSHKVFGNVKAPRFALLSDGTLVCALTSFGHLAISWSSDGGKTWKVTEEGKALSLDGDFYGYPGVCVLEDETLLVLYYDGANQQRRTGVWALKVRLAKDRQSYDLAPLDSGPGRGAVAGGSGDKLDADAASSASGDRQNKRS